MRLTYFCHSCFSAQIGGKTLLFDPFISPQARASGIDLAGVKADYLLISHGHEDHLAEAHEVAKRTGALLIANFEITEWFRAAGISNVAAMNLGGALRFEFGRVKMVNALHSSSLPDGRYGGNAGGFVIESAEGNFYYSGDTALTLDMQWIGNSTPLAFAVLCIGDVFTMGIDDALRAAELVKCRRILGVHYDTFPPIRIDRRAAVDQFRASGKELRLLEFGESADF